MVLGKIPNFGDVFVFFRNFPPSNKCKPHPNIPELLLPKVALLQVYFKFI